MPEFKYEGETALDVVFAVTDLLHEAKRRLPHAHLLKEYFREVEAALRRLEPVVEAVVECTPELFVQSVRRDLWRRPDVAAAAKQMTHEEGITEEALRRQLWNRLTPHFNGGGPHRYAQHRPGEFCLYCCKPYEWPTTLEGMEDP